MNKKMLTMAAAAIFAILYSSPAKAMAIPSHSIVVGNKAYSVDYVVKPANYGEINTQILNASNVYYVVNSDTVKDLFSNTYVSTNVIDSISTITFKDGNGEEYIARSGSNNLQHVDSPFAAGAKVDIGSGLNVLKKITVSSVRVPDANYYKIDGINAVKRVQSEYIQGIIPGNSVKVYLYADRNGNDLVAVGDLDISSSSGSSETPITNLNYATGNSSGNINNDGIVAADSNNQWIYYRGTNGDLYRIKSDGVDRTQLTSGHEAKYINVVGGYVYYVNTTVATRTTPASIGIYRMKTDGSDAQQITTGRTTQIAGNLVLSSSNEFEDVIVAGDWIYYINGADKSLHRISVEANGDATQDKVISSDKYTDINIVKNNIYAINISNDQNKIYRIDINGFTANKVSNVEAKHLNVVGEWIYYRNYSDNEKLYRMKLDGSEPAKICDDMACNINVSGDTVYYKNHSDADRLYKIGIDGTGGQQVLSPVLLNKGTKISNDVVEYVNVIDPNIYFSPQALSSVTSIAKDGSGRTVMK